MDELEKTMIRRTLAVVCTRVILQSLKALPEKQDKQNNNLVFS